MPLLFVLVVIFPIIVIAIYTLVIDGLFAHDLPGGRWSYRGKYRMRDRLWELNIGILGLLLSSGAAFVITGALKNATGKPRPDFVSRCQPKEGSFDINSFELYNDTICKILRLPKTALVVDLRLTVCPHLGAQEDHAIMKDGFRSFPSGHSSSSWGGLFYLSLYLAGKLHLLDHRGEVWKTFIVLVPTLGAALITVSRIEDARHHPFDVITGASLGTLCAYVAYRQYFPPLHEVWRKGRAYPIRSWGTTPLPPAGARGEDEMARDRGREPLRSAPLPGGFHNSTGPGAATGATVYERPDAASGDGNVFRAHVHATERMRQDHEMPAGAPRIIESPPPLPPGVSHERPTGPPSAALGRVESRPWDASSESEPEAYEMRTGYRPPPSRDESPSHPGAAATATVPSPYTSPPRGGPREV